MEDEERKVDLSHRTIQDEQARLRKKRQKAENVFAVFKKPLHESRTSVLPVMLMRSVGRSTELFVEYFSI